MTEEEMNEALFASLVMMFQGAAIQQMGKLINPMTGKVERDLEQAKLSIDILGMLEAKTKGNLTENEQRLLSHALFELRMNYLDEVNKPQPTEGGEEKQETGANSKQ
jgi:hypothetical protein